MLAYLLDNFWTIFVTIIITAIFCIIGVRYTLKSKPSGRMTLFVVSQISLFHEIVESISNLTVFVDGMPVDENLYLFRSFLVNTGNFDVEDSAIKKNLVIKLPEKYTFVDVRLEAGEIDATAKINKSKDEIEIDIKNIKKGEKIEITKLVQFPSRKQEMPFYLEGRIIDVDIDPVLSKTVRDEIITEFFDKSNALPILTLVVLMVGSFYLLILSIIRLDLLAFLILFCFTGLVFWVTFKYMIIPLYKKKAYIPFLFRKDIFS